MTTDNQKTEKPLILFAPIAAGGSHMSTAKAIIEAIEEEHPGEYRFEIPDIMEEYGFHRFDRHHKNTWRNALKYPLSIYLVQRVIDTFPRITNLVLRVILRGFAKEAARRFTGPNAPALVVATHSWTVVGLTLAQIRFGMDVPVLSFEVSTLNANALWAEPRIERYVVASENSKERLQWLGVPRKRIDIVGYPVGRAFIDAPSKEEARSKLGISQRFTCLISLGGEGIGGGEDIALEALKSFGNRIQIVVIAGKNEALYEKMRAIQPQFTELRVRGFVEDMASYVAACDVVIGKAGPAVAYEILAVGRPFLVTRRSGVVENKLLQVLKQLGISFYTPRADSIIKRVGTFLDNPTLLEDVAKVIERFDFDGMGKRMARYIEAYARTRKPLESQCDRGLDFEGLHLSRRLRKV